MKRVDLSFPQFGFAVATRAILGAGIGLLAAGRVGSCNRRRLGAALVAIGALATIPVAIAVFGGRDAAGEMSDRHSAA